MSRIISNIDEKKLQEAKEKLACHIQPPGTHSAWADAMEAAGAQNMPDGGGSGPAAVTSDGRVKLTQMTTAGG